MNTHLHMLTSTNKHILRAPHPNRSQGTTALNFTGSPTLHRSSFTLPCTPFQPISAQRGQQEIEVTNEHAGGLPKVRESLNYSTTIVVTVVAAVIVIRAVRGERVTITIPPEC